MGPGVDLVEAALQLLPHDRDGVGPQQEPERRLVGLDGVDDDVRGAGGVARLGAVTVVVLLAAAPGGVGVVGDDGADCMRERPEKSVRNAPGSRTSTRIPSGPTSRLSASETPSRAALVAV